MDVTPEIQKLIDAYKGADKAGKAKLRRSLRHRGFSLREYNKSQGKESKKVVEKPVAPVKKEKKVVAPKKAKDKKS